MLTALNCNIVKFLLNMCAKRAMLKRKPIFILQKAKFMKKLILTLGVLGLIFVGGFMFLLTQTTPDKAPSDPVVIDLTDKLGE